MSQRVRVCVCVGIVLFILAALVPPWIGVHTGGPIGYAPLCLPPGEYVEIDLPRLIVEWLVIAAATGGAVLLLSKSVGPSRKD